MVKVHTNDNNASHNELNLENFSRTKNISSIRTELLNISLGRACDLEAEIWALKQGDVNVGVFQ